MVSILTDTTASIPPDLVEELGIELVPYFVHRGNETLRDSVDISPAQFADWLATATVLPTTANPAPGDYLAGLHRLSERGDEIVALTMTAKGSGAFQACRAAVDQFHERRPDVRVEIIDTLQVGMSHGWAAIEAARAALSGASFEQVVEIGREVAHSGMMIQTADTLRYLYMGGRIGRAQHLVGSLLSIRPLIGMQDGVIVALGTARGRRKAYARMIDLLADHAGGKRRAKVAFTHVAAQDQVNQLRSLFADRFEVVETIVSALSPALAVHSGPGTVGISYYPLPA